MQTLDISGQLTTTPQLCRKLEKLTFDFSYQPKYISKALALARPPIPVVTQFRVVVPDHLRKP